MRYSPNANDISIMFNIITQSTPYISTLKSGGFTALFGKNTTYRSQSHFSSGGFMVLKPR